ncbi:hypothetical protein NW752_009394 [Fusarium irregulare]|uniref:N-acetyltransferase domain-containing protein n=1 Tax=Fusarium irregulare TaxID=2494466 RepID=A0A9W8PD08_9HYPO|nr:hypothetical protein NW766_012672 [Fusarium irregulare]KAJ4009099.1 hypothetical protein NW752_009394 [Fusarium irregulare]
MTSATTKEPGPVSGYPKFVTSTSDDTTRSWATRSRSILSSQIRVISNAYVKLVPLDLEYHLPTFFRLSQLCPELYAHTPWGPWNSVAELRAEFLDTEPTHDLSFTNPESFAFAIIDKTRRASDADPDGEVAGTISFTHISLTDLSTEIGFVIILPPYQRSHVASNAIGLALEYALEMPENGGLGLRRIHWKTSTENTASRRLAERLRFDMVGTTPWHMRYVQGKRRSKIGNGKEIPPGSDPEDLWRDTVNYSLAWDRWEGFARERTAQMMIKRS